MSGVTPAEHDWRVVLPWFQPENTTTVEPGTRFKGFVDYHTAPQGTRVRFGRNGFGELMVKRGDAWFPDGGASGGVTAYGMENRVSRVE